MNGNSILPRTLSVGNVGEEAEGSEAISIYILLFNIQGTLEYWRTCKACVSRYNVLSASWILRFWLHYSSLVSIDIVSWQSMFCGSCTIYRYAVYVYELLCRTRLFICRTAEKAEMISLTALCVDRYISTIH